MILILPKGKRPQCATSNVLLMSPFHLGLSVDYPMAVLAAVLTVLTTAVVFFFFVRAKFNSTESWIRQVNGRCVVGKTRTKQDKTCPVTTLRPSFFLFFFFSFSFTSRPRPSYCLDGKPESGDISGFRQ